MHMHTTDYIFIPYIQRCREQSTRTTYINVVIWREKRCWILIKICQIYEILKCFIVFYYVSYLKSIKGVIYSLRDVIHLKKNSFFFVSFLLWQLFIYSFFLSIFWSNVSFFPTMSLSFVFSTFKSSVPLLLLFFLKFYMFPY